MSQVVNGNNDEWSVDVCRVRIEENVLRLSEGFTSLPGDERSCIARNLEVLCKYFIKNVPPSLLESDLFSKVLPKIEATLTILIRQISSIFHDQYSSKCDLEYLVKDVVALLGCVERCFETEATELDHVLTLPTTALSISHKLFALYEDCRKCDGFPTVSDLLSTVFNQTTALTTRFISLWTNISLLISLEEHVKVVLDVCISLNNICQIFESISGKSPVTLWKIYISTLVKYCHAIKDQVNVADTIRLLCSQIENRLKDLKLLCTDQSANKDVIIKSVQQCSFNLKIILNLAEKFQFFLGDCFDNLLDLVLSLYENSTPSLTALNIPDSLKRNLTIVTELLISALLVEPEFVALLTVKSFPDQNIKHSAYSWTLFYVFVLENMHKMSENLQNDLLPIATPTSNNILQNFFEAFSKCSVEISLPVLLPGVMCEGKPLKLVSFYEYCCTRLSGFIVGISAQHFSLLENVLLTNVLSGDLWKSQLAADLWTFLGRLESAELCFIHCCILADLTKEVCVGQRLSQILRRLFNILADEHKLLFYNKYHPTKRPEIWVCVGFRGLTTVSSLLDEMNRLSNTLGERIKISLDDENISGSKLSEMSNSISLLSELAEVISKPNLQHVELCIRLWRCLPTDLVTSNDIIAIFVFQLIKWTSALLAVIPNNLLLEVVTKMCELQGNAVSTIVNYGVLWFLDSFSDKAVPATVEQNHILRLISLLMSNCLQESNPIILNIGLETFANISQMTPHETIISGSLYQKPLLQQLVSKFLKKVPLLSSVESEADLKTLLMAQTNDLSSQLPTVNGEIEMLKEKNKLQCLPEDVHRVLCEVENSINKLSQLDIPLETDISLLTTHVHKLQQQLVHFLRDKCSS